MTAPKAEAQSLPPSLQLLKWLVILLTASLIGGVIAVVWLLVTRLPVPMMKSTAPAEAAYALPADLALPQGIAVVSASFGPDYLLLVTSDHMLRIYSRDGKPLSQTALPAP